jgi:hypothetical protein
LLQTDIPNNATSDRGNRNDDENLDQNVTSESNDSHGDNVTRNVVCRDVLFDDSAQDVISALGAPGDN